MVGMQPRSTRPNQWGLWSELDGVITLSSPAIKKWNSTLQLWLKIKKMETKWYEMAVKWSETWNNMKINWAFNCSIMIMNHTVQIVLLKQWMSKKILNGHMTISTLPDNFFSLLFFFVYIGNAIMGQGGHLGAFNNVTLALVAMRNSPVKGFVQGTNMLNMSFPCSQQGCPEFEHLVSSKADKSILRSMASCMDSTSIGLWGASD